MDTYSNEDRLSRVFLKKNKLAIISITNRCNLHCIYCRPLGEENWYDKLSKFSNKNEKLKNISLLLNDDIIEVMLSGGEPLAAKNIITLALDLKKNGKFISIHTNGVHHKASEILASLYNEKINLNFHVSSELLEEHQTTLRQCKMPYAFIEKAAKEYGFKVELKVILHSLLTTHVENFHKIIDDWLNHGVSQIRFQPIVQTGNIPTELILQTKDSIIIQKLLELKQNERYKNKIRNSNDSLETILKVINKKENKIYKKCDMHEKIIFINYNGDVINCATMWGKNINCCNHTFDFVCCGFTS
ncbi:radical SAM protein [Brenneria rubrifaciens]|uniref:Radical SAM protein n=1 Tax=Brenneria rubrifaciens TaxID=55213 RepID=A0A4P8QRG4_9GAMM|nr:radical SAM protein [Brenneria rubrifaciens]QCR08129.1 radical SAM protein [Brenneria rubrifaciens]